MPDGEDEEATALCQKGDTSENSAAFATVDCTERSVVQYGNHPDMIFAGLDVRVSFFAGTDAVAAGRDTAKFEARTAPANAEMANVCTNMSEPFTRIWLSIGGFLLEGRTVAIADDVTMIEGEEVDEERSDEESKALLAKAEEIIVNRVSARSRSERELADALSRKGIPDDIIEQALENATKAGLVNDEEFAVAWTSSRQRNQRLAPSAIRYELLRKGVDRDLIDSALAEINEEDEEAAARDLVERKLRSTATLPEHVRVRRLVGALARKGYAPGLAYRVVQDVIAGAESE